MLKVYGPSGRLTGNGTLPRLPRKMKKAIKSGAFWRHVERRLASEPDTDVDDRSVIRLRGILAMSGFYKAALGVKAGFAGSRDAYERYVWP